MVKKSGLEVLLLLMSYCVITVHQPGCRYGSEGACNNYVCSFLFANWWAMNFHYLLATLAASHQCKIKDLFFAKVYVLLNY